MIRYIFARARRCALLSTTVALVLFSTSVGTVGAEAGTSPVRLRTRTFVPTTDLSALYAIAEGAGTRHLLVQLATPPTPDERRRLAGDGLRLLAYVPEHTWIASVTPAAASRAEVRERLIWAGPIAPTDKLPVRWTTTGIVPAAIDADGRVALHVRLHRDVDPAHATRALRARGIDVVRATGLHPTLEVRSPRWQIPAIAAVDAVLAIREDAFEIVPSNDSSRGAMDVETVNDPPYGLDGTGIRIGVWDGGRIDPDHDDFAGRLTIVEAAPISEHATHVAGTAAGSGALSGSRGGTPFQWRGMAPGALLYSAHHDDDVPTEMAAAIATHDLDQITNSWNWQVGTGFCDLQGDYDLFAPELDAVVRGAGGHPVTITHSAGNERDDGDCPLIDGAYGCVLAPSTAKNVITVGATNSDDDTSTDFSSYGPVDDGRLKPDLTAPGCQTDGDEAVTSAVPGDDYGVLCGTSMAAPAVAGVVALLRQLHHGLHGAGARPEPSMQKAILTATAIDLGHPGPDFAFGHGRVDAPAAADAMLEDTQVPVELGHGTVEEIPFRVPSTLPGLRMTLAWDDPPAVALAAITLVNDLDLVLEDPDGGHHRPWVLDPAMPSLHAVRGEDHRNNVEHVTVDDPVPGLWRVRVTGTNVPDGPQLASLAGLDLSAPPSPGSFRVVGSSETAIELAWDAPDTHDRRGTLLVRSIDPILWTGPEQGAELIVGDPAGNATVIHVGDEDHATDPFVDEDVVADTRYYYAAYTFDDWHNHSEPTLVDAVAGVEVAVDVVGAAAPFAVGVARPNPARSGTVVPFSLDVDGAVTLTIYDASGRRVRTLVHATLAAGRYEARWDGTDAAGRPVAAGTVFYTLRAGERRASGRLIWMR